MKNHPKWKRRAHRQTLRQFILDERVPWRVRYETYLNSWIWAEFRKKILDARGLMCERCGASAPAAALHVHHLTYIRMGKELPEDVKLLCVPCHKLMHH